MPRSKSLYQAGALALQQFRRSEWSREASLDAGALRVELWESTFYPVGLRSGLRSLLGAGGRRRILRSLAGYRLGLRCGFRALVGI